MPLIKSALQPMRSGQRRVGYCLNFIKTNYESFCLSYFRVNSCEFWSANAHKNQNRKMATTLFYVLLIGRALKL